MGLTTSTSDTSIPDVSNESSLIFTSIYTSNKNKTITNDQLYCLVLEIMTLEAKSQLIRIVNICKNFIMSIEQNEILDILKRSPPLDITFLINFETISLTPLLDFILDNKIIDITSDFDKMLLMDMGLASMKATMQKIEFTSNDYKSILKNKIGYVM